MATTVTIEMPAEDLRWPRRCVCCGSVDEADVEVIVPDTSDSDRRLEEVITAAVPHCLECRDHAGMGFGAMQIVAFVVVLCLAVAFGISSLGHGPVLVAGGLIVIAVVIGLDQANIRRHMRRGCVSARQAYRFVHPCGREITSILFLNDSFARELSALNGRGVYEP